MNALLVREFRLARNVLVHRRSEKVEDLTDARGRVYLGRGRRDCRCRALGLDRLHSLMPRGKKSAFGCPLWQLLTLLHGQRRIEIVCDVFTLRSKLVVAFKGSGYVRSTLLSICFTTKEERS